MKLEEIKKKNIYTVPDKYFDQLPTRIQSRVNEKTPVSTLHWNWGWLYKLAIPAAAVLFLIFYFGKTDFNTPQNAEAILDQVSTDDVIAYLSEMDLSTSEIIETIDFSNFEFYETGMLPQDIELEENVMDILTDEYGMSDDIL